MMLVVFIEEWPDGREEHAQEIDRLYIWNVSRLAPVSDYRWSRLKPQHRETGKLIKAHRRADGALELVRRVLNESM